MGNPVILLSRWNQATYIEIHFNFSSKQLYSLEQLEYTRRYFLVTFNFKNL